MIGIGRAGGVGRAGMRGSERRCFCGVRFTGDVGGLGVDMHGTVADVAGPSALFHDAQNVGGVR